MRTEEEMMELILNTAKNDNRVRGVYMNGSRINPNAPKDIFQDYDIVYIVKETASFIKEEKWIDIFGERLYMQCPEEMDRLLGKESDCENNYGYLMQLADGNRIDIHIKTLPCALQDILSDRQCRILLDKDGKLPKILPETDEDHWVKKPSLEEYKCCCNEYWWVLNNVGKGLWRKEVTYAMDMINQILRPQLITMLSWEIGINTGFSCSVGKFGKYMDRYLQKRKWEDFLQTYSAANFDKIWQAVFKMCDLFEETSKEVGERLDYPFDETEAHNSRLYFDCICELPSDAKEIYMVRRMKPSDVEEVSAIWLEENINVHSFIPESYWRKNCAMVKQQLLETEVYLYENQKEIVGFVGINMGYVQGIFVKENMRSRGIGRMLMKTCKSKYFKIYLNVYCQNEEAVKFYMKEGFKIAKKQIDKGTNHSEYEMIWKQEG